MQKNLTYFWLKVHSRIIKVGRICHGDWKILYEEKKKHEEKKAEKKRIRRAEEKLAFLLTDEFTVIFNYSLACFYVSVPPPHCDGKTRLSSE